MSDPFSIVAGAVGIVAAGVQLSSSLYNICEKIGTAQNDIENIASDLSFFVIVVDELGKIFKSPKKIFSQQLENSVRKIIERCRTLFKQIKHMIGKTADVPKLRLKSKVAWVFRESKVKEIRANLESLKSTLGLILHALRLVKDELQGDIDERHVLANLLRSQRYSISVLRSLKKEKKTKQQGKVPNDPTNVSSGMTAANADLLSEAVPSPPPAKKASTTSNQRSDNPTRWRSFPVMLSSEFERSLGELYPLWKQQVLENVDFLLRTWTHVAISDPFSGFVPDEELNKAENIIQEETRDLNAREESYEESHKLFADRLQKLEDRLKKREKGWLDIDDAALARLEGEMLELREKRKDCEAEMSSCTSRKNELEDQLQRATDLWKQRCKKDPGTKTFKIPDITPYASYEPTDSGKTSLQWLEDAQLDESDDRSDDEDPDKPSPPLSFAPPPPPNFQSPQSSAPSAAGTDAEVVVNCERDAWKPPHSFLTGSNIFSNVLDSVKHPQLWFTASQDVYFFYLGAQETPFYTIHLVPSDLSSYETSKLEWTVVQKPWATHKALRAMGFPYIEDSIGFVWIRKNLNWYQIRQLFEFSCGLLDNAMNESSRSILVKRSTSGKKPWQERSFLAPLSGWEGKSDIHSVVCGRHPVFFHAEDEDLQRRRKRSKSMESKHSNS